LSFASKSPAPVRENLPCDKRRTVTFNTKAKRYVDPANLNGEVFTWYTALVIGKYVTLHKTAQQ
jgi:hypothetical protein